MSTLLSANMSLPVPVVGQEPGPEYATDVNNCMGIIDSHNHAPGQGVQIDPTGLNINVDLTMNANNLIDVRSVRLDEQASAIAEAEDLGCIYNVLGDLFYNDGLGNQIQITQNGGIAGTPGSIANLVPPASASYVAAQESFVWESDVNTPANLDCGAVILRKIVASSPGITLQVPVSLASDYTITLPALPASQKFMTLDSSGNISAPWAVDGASLEISSNTLRVKALGIQTSMLAAQSVSQDKLALKTLSSTTVAAGGIGISPSSGTQTLGTGGEVDITNATITITTLGRPVVLKLQSASTSTGSPSYMGIQGGGQLQISFFRDSTRLDVSQINSSNSFGGATDEHAPGSFAFVDTPAAGTYVYKVTGKNITNTGFAFNVQLVCYEM
jgi:hypothetical protein